MTPVKPMLAKDADLPKVKYPVAVQPKLDGVRAIVQDGVVYSRSLKRIPNAEVQAVLGSTGEYDGLDGELIVGDPTADDCYRQTSSFVMSESKTGADWTFYVFDSVDMGQVPYSERRTRLLNIASTFNPDDSVVLVPEVHASNEGELERMEATLIDQGHEGVILRTLNGVYKHGRSGKTGPLLKVKRFVDFECVVLDSYEEQHNGNVGFTNELGRTARSTAKAGKVGKGTLGGLIVSPLDDSVSNPSVTFRVGTGFDAATRAALWAERDTLPGRTAKIKSFPVGVKDKPRHPVWLGWRDVEVDG